MGEWRVKNEGLQRYHAAADALRRRFASFEARQVCAGASFEAQLPHGAAAGRAAVPCPGVRQGRSPCCAPPAAQPGKRPGLQVCRLQRLGGCFLAAFPPFRRPTPSTWEATQPTHHALAPHSPTPAGSARVQQGGGRAIQPSHWRLPLRCQPSPVAPGGSRGGSAGGSGGSRGGGRGSSGGSGGRGRGGWRRRRGWRLAQGCNGKAASVGVSCLHLPLLSLALCNAVCKARMQDGVSHASSRLIA